MDELMKLNEIKNKNKYDSIVKNNNLVKGSYTVTATEQKFLYKVFEYIQENEYETNTIVFNLDNLLSEFKDIISSNISKNEFWRMLATLQDKKAKIINEGEYIRAEWYTLKKSLSMNVITIVLNPEIFKYVKSQKTNFSKLLKNSIYSFRSFYTMRLYEYFKSWCNLKDQDEIPLDLFKIELDIASKKTFEKFNMIKTRVIEPGIKEMNEISELEVTYEPIKKGRKVVAIRFIVLNNSEKINEIDVICNKLNTGDTDKITKAQLNKIITSKTLDSKTILKATILLSEMLQKESPLEVDVEFQEVDNKEKELETIDDFSIDIDKELANLSKKKVSKKKTITILEKYKKVCNPYESAFESKEYDRFTNLCFDKHLYFGEDIVLRKILNLSIEVIKTKFDSLINENNYKYFVAVFEKMKEEKYKIFEEEERFRLERDLNLSEESPEDVWEDLVKSSNKY